MLLIRYLPAPLWKCMVLVVSSPPGLQCSAGYPTVAGVAQRTGSSSPQWQTPSAVASPQWCGRGTSPVEYSFKIRTWERRIGQKRKWVLMRIFIQTMFTAGATGVGSHLYVSCRSICNRDQNWIKQSKPFWRADQGLQTAKINRSRTHGYNLTFDPLKIKQSSTQKGTIKHTFSLIKNLDPGCKPTGDI